MVDVDINRSEGISIIEVPGLGKLLQNIRDVFHKCKEREDVEGAGIEMKSVWVVGSYARDRAIKGESDIDLVVTLSNPEGEELDAKFDILEGNVSACMQEHERDIIEGFEGWFSGVDILSTKTVNEILKLQRFTTETRTERELGIPRVFDLEEMEFVSRDEIEKVMVEKGGQGELKEV